MLYESAGSGLWSTLDDYLSFARLFVEGGQVDGVRLLRPETVAMMAANRLTDTQRATSGWLGRKPFAVGRGFGLGVSVVLETDSSDLMRRRQPRNRQLARCLRRLVAGRSPGPLGANFPRSQHGRLSANVPRNRLRRLGRHRSLSNSGLGAPVSSGIQIHFLSSQSFIPAATTAFNSVSSAASGVDLKLKHPLPRFRFFNSGDSDFSRGPFM